MQNYEKETIAVHSGTYHDPVIRGVNSPIFMSTANGYIDEEIQRYPRYFTMPNQDNVVRKVCELEGAEDGLLFSSGMAAISTTLLGLMEKGDHIILQNDIYGGSHSLATGSFDKYGIEYTFVPNPEEREFSGSIKKNTKIIYIETPSNPLLKIVDIKMIGELAKSRNLISVIDSTFATPVNQNPIKMGIDIVIHSATKYLGGHSDIQSGIVVSKKNIIGRIRETAYRLGGCLNSISCYFLERSIKTLFLRMEKHNYNAFEIAKHLSNNPKIKTVYYPGLDSHENHDLAKTQMKGFGGIVSFEINEKGPPADEFLNKLKLIMPALSLGGLESTICVPAKTSHARITREERMKAGITDNLLRLSTGIESVKDLLDDLDKALT